MLAVTFFFWGGAVNRKEKVPPSILCEFCSCAKKYFGLILLSTEHTFKGTYTRLLLFSFFLITFRNSLCMKPYSLLSFFVLISPTLQLGTGKEENKMYFKNLLLLPGRQRKRRRNRGRRKKLIRELNFPQDDFAQKKVSIKVDFELSSGSFVFFFLF